MLQTFLQSLTVADIIQLVGVIGTILGGIVAYRRLKPEHDKLNAEQRLTKAEASALVTDKAISLLEETEERLHQEIDHLQQVLAETQAKLAECQTIIQELENQLEDSNNALWLARQHANRLQQLVDKLTAQLKDAGITPKSFDS